VNEELESELWEDAMRTSVGGRAIAKAHDNVDCDHAKYTDDHCSYYSCWNYYSKCPKHSLPGQRSDARCSRMLS
jgi:hypothetical protein